MPPGVSAAGGACKPPARPPLAGRQPDGSLLTSLVDTGGGSRRPGRWQPPGQPVHAQPPPAGCERARSTRSGHRAEVISDRRRRTVSMLLPGSHVLDRSGRQTDPQRRRRAAVPELGIGRRGAAGRKWCAAPHHRNTAAGREVAACLTVATVFHDTSLPPRATAPERPASAALDNSHEPHAGCATDRSSVGQVGADAGRMVTVGCRRRRHAALAAAESTHRSVHRQAPSQHRRPADTAPGHRWYAGRDAIRRPASRPRCRLGMGSAARRRCRSAG